MPNPPNISVTFAYTLDELVELNLRSLKHSQKFQRERLRSYSITAVGSFVMLYLLLNYSQPKRTLLAVFAAIIGICCYWVIEKRLAVRRFKRYFAKQITQPWPISVEIELTETGVIATERKQRSIVKWEEFAKVVETNGAIEFYLRAGGLIIVRARAFADEAQRQAFLAFAQKYLQT